MMFGTIIHSLGTNIVKASCHRQYRIGLLEVEHILILRQLVKDRINY